MELTLEEAKAWNECIRNSSVIAPTLFSAAIGYGIFWVSPFRAQAKIAAVVGGVLGLISGRVAISELCLAKVASMPNSNLKDRLIEAGHYGMYKPRYIAAFSLNNPTDVRALYCSESSRLCLQ